MAVGVSGEIFGVLKDSKSLKFRTSRDSVLSIYLSDIFASGGSEKTSAYLALTACGPGDLDSSFCLAVTVFEGLEGDPLKCSM